MNRRYYYWLLSLINIPEKSNYSMLFKDLSLKEFFWDQTIVSDGNRADDGLNLRLLYFHETGDALAGGSGCSVLEMLIALSIRIECDIMGEPGDDHPEKWLWEMLNNLSLTSMTNDEYDEEYVDYILDMWLNREYKSNGSGSLFPLKRSKANQRLIPIWDQMGEYLNERYLK